MKLQDLDLEGTYSYADYLTWKFKETVELIRGKVIKMSPAPRLYHQKISTKLITRIDYFLGRKSCDVFYAPFDVRLPLPPSQIKDDQIDTVVQPDISVVCDASKLDKRGCPGPPDWIIEILSPGTVQKYLREKYQVYEYAKVKEYWIVYPAEQSVVVYSLNKSGKYEGHQPYSKADKISPYLFPELSIDLEEVFPEMDLAEEDWGAYVRM